MKGQTLICAQSRVLFRKFLKAVRIFAAVGLAIICLAGLGTSVAEAATTNYFVRGVLKEVKRDERRLVIAHESIPHFMDAMTMPFNVKDAAIFDKMKAGDQITFQLHVTETESWVDHIEQPNGTRSAASPPANLPKGDLNSKAKPDSAAVARTPNPLRYYKFTNELGQPVSLSDFKGQAVALTFFYASCPIPEFCPRLSRNFEEVESQMSRLENAPTNWHLISVTFDPDRDTPEALKTYGARFHYDSAHWSFLTGPKDKIAELARLCDVKFDSDNGLINHNFRTLIIDASNHLQMVFPTSGDLSGSIVQELLKAAGATNHIAGSATAIVRSETVKP